MEDIDQSSEWLLPTQTSDNEILGNPQKIPRIGDEYQAKIPNLMTKNDLFQLINSPTFQDSKIAVQNDLNLGLSIPVMWVCDQHKTVGIYSKADCVPVPGSVDESWSIVEKESFVLGLYIFGKNLRVLKKFVGSKGMGNVISYYYGQFYRSSEYGRWSKFRKKKSKKSKPGERIFTASRQQELLSRVSSYMTEECKNSLVEAGKMFGDGKVSLEEYVFTLKDKIGIHLLIDAIAIGKGKQDLTKTAMELPKTSLNHPRQKSLSGKPCSSLTTGEIVNFLKGDVRLSKAKSNDLFWEAVWPRLLARGWHSEQPRNYVCRNSKHSLVFLPPGVTKFSGKLKKGSHYFASPSDVLSKVASEPELLELEPGHNKFVDPDTKNGSDDEKQEPMEFTIVDTSFVKVRERRSLPAIKPAQETKRDATKEPRNEDSSHGNVVSSPKSQSCTVKNDMVSRKEDKKTDLCTDGQLKREVKFKFARKRKPQKPKDSEVPTMKRSDFHSCNESKPDETTSNNHGFHERREVVEKEASDKKCGALWIDLNLSQVGPNSDREEPLISTNSTSKQSEFSNPTKAETDVDKQTVINGQRQSTRNRPLTVKALEALASGYLRPKKKKRKRSEETPPRRVRAKTALVSSCGAGDVEKAMDGVSFSYGM